VLRKLAVPLLLGAIIATAVVAELVPTSPAGAGDASTGSTTSSCRSP
jgi:hypothetical protein